uniref:Uncharacterized protein n=1 Tax=Branchiostoma floridae TaxID=7739 RepID=C3ZTG3_BRAFL|eukprot:XP_002588199.1 hypothetical protein BRAFLDRAFT_68842 [Branchiostoma floridae]
MWMPYIGLNRFLDRKKYVWPFQRAQPADVREGGVADEENNQEVSDRGRHVNGEDEAGMLKKIVEDKYEPPKPISRPAPHVSHSQQEFFRLLDQKIDQGRDYMTDDEEAR